MKIKICVNSTKSYSEKTLPIIIPSLINSGIDPEDIFVFEGGHIIFKEGTIAGFTIKIDFFKNLIYNRV